MADADDPQDQAECERIFECIDANDDADDPQDQAERERIFKRLDANGDGKISAVELGDALQTLGRVTVDEVKHMMDEIDTDGDGFISFQEFIAFALANRRLIKDVAAIFY